MELATSIMLCISTGSYMCATCIAGCCCYKLCNKNKEKKDEDKEEILKITKYSSQKEKDNKVFEPIFLSTDDKKKTITNEPQNIKQKTNKYIYYKFDNYSNKKELKDFFNYNDCDEFVGLEKFIQMLYNQSNTDYTLILHISSPGGSAFDFEKLYDKLMDLRKKNITIIGIIDDVCASGGYMLACACNKIYATNNAHIGSIGVYTTHINAKKLGDKIGIEEIKFKTSNAKGGLSVFGEITDDEKNNVSDIIDYTFTNFKNIVTKARTDIDIEQVSNAKVWYGKDAHNMKLVDDIISYNEYVHTLIEDGELYIVTLNKKKDNKSLLMNLLGENISDNITDNITDNISDSIINSITNIFNKSIKFVETKLKML